MVKLVPQIIFSAAMLVLGFTSVFFTEKIRTCILKVIGQKGVFVNIVDSAQTVRSMKFGGVIAILIGLFIMWVTWRNC
jgi:hypothetical protein